MRTSANAQSRRRPIAKVTALVCLALALTILGEARVSASQSSAFAMPVGSCHARGSGLFVLPDARCTPGATNPAVTQATIARTICTSGWSESVRPPESVTEPQKRLALASYGYYDGHSLGKYEFDHLINISLGGALDSPRNLWPEADYPGVSPSSYYLNPKDKLEDKLHALVCEKRMSLRSAQKLIATNWIAGYRKLIGPVTPTRSSPAASCTVSASYDSKYHDYDVYVRSNRPDETVTVTDTHGDSHSYSTNSSGYADVYLDVHGNPAGQRVTAKVGGATCSTTL